MSIIQRDIKSDNIILVNNDENSPIKLWDFGLSKLIIPN